MLVGLLFLAASIDPANWTSAEKEHFLLTATIQDEAYAGKGLTNSQKATATDGRTTHSIHIQYIDIHQPLFTGKDGSTERDFKDSWKFNVAAYRLARLLRLTNMTPVCVARPVDGRPASVCWWIENVWMDERERLNKNIQPPDPAAWRRQMDIVRTFDQLIYNMDRSQENLLIDKSWHAWMIDHTRSFRKWRTLRNPAAITHCNADLYQALKDLRRTDVVRDLGEFLTTEEIDGLMARRDLIVQKLAENGGQAIVPAPAF